MWEGVGEFGDCGGDDGEALRVRGVVGDCEFGEAEFEVGEGA